MKLRGVWGPSLRSRAWSPRGGGKRIAAVDLCRPPSCWTDTDLGAFDGHSQPRGSGRDRPDFLQTLILIQFAVVILAAPAATQRLVCVDNHAVRSFTPSSPT